MLGPLQFWLNIWKMKENQIKISLLSKVYTYHMKFGSDFPVLVIFLAAYGEPFMWPLGFLHFPQVTCQPTVLCPVICSDSLESPIY